MLNFQSKLGKSRQHTPQHTNQPLNNPIKLPGDLVARGAVKEHVNSLKSV